eukprot:3715578-Amphidinium_carterae.2
MLDDCSLWTCTWSSKPRHERTTVGVDAARQSTRRTRHPGGCPDLARFGEHVLSSTRTTYALVYIVSRSLNQVVLFEKDLVLIGSCN